MHLGLSPEEIDALDDETYTLRAGEALYLQQRAQQAVKDGVIEALAELFRR